MKFCLIIIICFVEAEAGVDPLRVILKAASLLALFRIACLWYLFYGEIPSYSPPGIALVVSCYFPEGLFLSDLFPRNISGDIWPLIVYSMILAISSCLIVSMLAGTMVLVRRL